MTSIIVPVYNIAEYIERCIESLRNQTIRDIEIILIDDSSKDGSSEICDKLSKEDGRIKVIHNKRNGGLSEARNKGIEVAAGQYLTFVDGDDYVSKDYIEYLLHIINDYDVDISIGSYQIINGENDINNTRIANDIITMGCEEAIKRYLYGKISVSATTKLYKKSLFEDITFPSGKQFEDIFTTLQLIKKATRIGIGEKPIYAYVMRNDSIVHQEFSKSKLDRIELAKRVLDEMTLEGEEIRLAAERFYVNQCVATLRVVPLSDGFDSVRREIRREINKYAINVLKNKEASLNDKLSVIVSQFGKRFIWTASSIYEMIK